MTAARATTHVYAADDRQRIPATMYLFASGGDGKRRAAADTGRLRPGSGRVAPGGVITPTGADAADRAADPRG